MRPFQVFNGRIAFHFKIVVLHTKVFQKLELVFYHFNVLVLTKVTQEVRNFSDTLCTVYPFCMLIYGLFHMCLVLLL